MEGAANKRARGDDHFSADLAWKKILYKLLWTLRQITPLLERLLQPKNRMEDLPLRPGQDHQEVTPTSTSSAWTRVEMASDWNQLAHRRSPACQDLLQVSHGRVRPLPR